MPPRVIEGVDGLKTLIGQEVGVSDWLTLTQSMIDSFADVTRDRQWIHTDPERAKTESPFRSTIAHGFLTLSLMTHLHSQAVQIHGNFRMAINYGLNRVRFVSPVLSGARIRLHSTLQAVEEIPKGVHVIWEMSMEIEGSAKPALVAEWVGRLYLG